MAEILGNELLIKALGKKGWREVRVWVCVCSEQQLRQHEAMTPRHEPGIICGTADSHLSQ